MTMNLSIKNVPVELVEALRTRAGRHHRSLQGELLAIIEASVAAPQRLSLRVLGAEAQRLGLATPAESAALIREERDGR